MGDGYILGLDCGTQSAKACIWDREGRCVARASAPLSVSAPHPGWAEQDPAEWWGSARAAIAQAASSIDATRLVALGIAFQRETFTLADARGAPLRPGILWLDIRADGETAEISGTFGADAIHRLTGKPLDVTSAVPRMRWIAHHEPDVLRRAARWMDVCSCIVERMTGELVTCVAGADTSGLVESFHAAVVDRAAGPRGPGAHRPAAPGRARHDRGRRDAGRCASSGRAAGAAGRRGRG